MSEADIKTRVKRLKKYDAAYYNGQEPLVSDADYDTYREETVAMFKALIKSMGKEACAKSEIMVGARDYFRTTGAPISNGRDTKLPVFMHSLNKVKSDSLNSFNKYMTSFLLVHTKLVDNKTYDRRSIPLFISPKLDGLSVLITYTNGKLSGAYTRGNGEVGQYKLAHAKALAAAGCIPKIIKKSICGHDVGNMVIHIRGELLISLNVFEKRWKDDFSSARSAVTGFLNAQTPNTALATDLSFFAFSAYDVDGNHLDIFSPKQRKRLMSDKAVIVGKEPVESVNSNFKYTLITELEEAGFTTYSRSGRGPIQCLHITDKFSDSAFAALCKRLEASYKNKTSFPFLTDGLVVEVGDSSIRNMLKHGADTRPKYAFAFKSGDADNTEAAQTVITDITFETSKSRAIIPTTHFTPVLVSNTKLAKATGANVSYLLKNKLGIGTNVRVVKAGGIIPRVLHESGNSLKGCIPKACSCGGDVVQIGPHYYCNADRCPVAELAQICDAVTRLKIRGLGNSIVAKLSDNGYKTFASILSASVDDLLSIPGFGENTAKLVAIDLRERINNASVAELLSLSGAFTRPGFSLGAKAFATIAEVLKRGEEISAKTIKKAALGEAASKVLRDGAANYNEFIKSLNRR